jgi:hypothetical protein
MSEEKLTKGVKMFKFQLENSTRKAEFLTGIGLTRYGYNQQVKA